MTDLWGFLLQTLTASGAAALLLVVKAMFRDKLSPRWQFAAWGVLGLVLLFPAGLGGRYVLVNWPLLVETVKTFLTGDYSLTHVLAPIPLPRLQMPKSAADWLYAVYATGVLLLLARYVFSYIHLRLALRRGTPVGEERCAQIQAVAERYGLFPCRAREVPGLKTAFICGVFRPVLALPAGVEVDDKVLLHELLHRKHRDAAWGLVICFFRCVHWCNPLLWTCADRAGNDLEALCDQRVLEMLEGEERRDYGHILLSMADEKYARTPGTSSMANGGHNVKRRIEAIARFKKYPAGMALVSVCVVILLAAPLLLGVRAEAVYEGGGFLPSDLHISVSMASARLLRCTTPAGALDTYAKSVLENSGYYRAMCAPLAEQEKIADRLRLSLQWDSGLPASPYTPSGYRIYNLQPVGEDAYEGLLAVQLSCPPGGPIEGSGVWLGVQQVRTECQDGRWAVAPLEDFRAVQTSWSTLPRYACDELPAYCYEAQGAGFTIRLRYQTSFSMDSSIENNDWFYSGESLDAIYTGDPADQDGITSIGVSFAPMGENGSRPTLRNPGTGDSGGSGSDGSVWDVKSLEKGWGPEVRLAGGGTGGSGSDGSVWDVKSLEKGWGPEVRLAGGGTGGSGSLEDLMGPEDLILPEAFAADLYINGKKAAELTLLSVEGGPAS